MHLDFTHTVSLREWGGGYLCSVNIPEGAGGSILHVNRWWRGSKIWFRIFHPALFLQPSSLLSNHIQATLASASSQSFQLVLMCRLWSSQALWWHGPREWRARVTSMALCSARALPWQAFSRCALPHRWASSQLYFLLAYFLGMDPWKRNWQINGLWQFIDLVARCLSAFRKPETMKGAIARTRVHSVPPRSWQCRGPVLFAC